MSETGPSTGPVWWDPEPENCDEAAGRAGTGRPSGRPLPPFAWSTTSPADRSALSDRARGPWAATRRPPTWAGARPPPASGRGAGPPAPHPVAGGPLTGPEAVVPVDRFVAYLEEAERAFPEDSPADLLSRIRNTYYSGFLVSQLLPDSRAHGGQDPARQPAAWDGTPPTAT